MAFWMILMFLLLVIVIGVLVYRQDNTTFSRSTGYSFFDILFKRRAKYFHNMTQPLEGVKGHYRMLLDMKVSNEQGQGYADVVFIHESGIYVMNGVDKSGWITGSESQIEWLEVHHKGQQHFYNPMRTNKHMIGILKRILPEIDSDAFSSVVVLSDACSIQKIEIYSQDAEILKIRELKQWTAQMDEKVLSADEIDRVYLALEAYTGFHNDTNQGMPFAANS